MYTMNEWSPLHAQRADEGQIIRRGVPRMLAEGQTSRKVGQQRSAQRRSASDQHNTSYWRSPTIPYCNAAPTIPRWRVTCHYNLRGRSIGSGVVRRKMLVTCAPVSTPRTFYWLRDRLFPPHVLFHKYQWLSHLAFAFFHQSFAYF